jgi:hypothetical protein
VNPNPSKLNHVEEHAADQRAEDEELAIMISST